MEEDYANKLVEVWWQGNILRDIEARGLINETNKHRVLGLVGQEKIVSYPIVPATLNQIENVHYYPVFIFRGQADPGVN